MGASRFHQRRTWTVAVGPEDHVVVVDYDALRGFMSIEIDGQRVAGGRPWWQPAFGGAKLEAMVEGRTLSARVTQISRLRGGYRFSLSLDGKVLPDGEAEPISEETRRRTIIALVAVGIVVIVINFILIGVLSR